MNSCGKFLRYLQSLSMFGKNKFSIFFPMHTWKGHKDNILLPLHICLDFLCENLQVTQAEYLQSILGKYLWNLNIKQRPNKATVSVEAPQAQAQEVREKNGVPISINQIAIPFQAVSLYEADLKFNARLSWIEQQKCVTSWNAVVPLFKIQVVFKKTGNLAGDIMYALENVWRYKTLVCITNL